jgi:hypothetical protein
MIENIILSKISEHGNWDLDLFREITHIVQPLYASHSIKQGLEPDHPTEAATYPDQDDENRYLLNASHFDIPVVTPSYLFLSQGSETLLDSKKDPSSQISNSDSYLQKYVMRLANQNTRKPASSLPTEAMNELDDLEQNQKEMDTVRMTLTSRDGITSPQAKMVANRGVHTPFVDEDEVIHLGWGNQGDDGDLELHRGVSTIPSSASSSGQIRRRIRTHVAPIAPAKLGGLGPDLENQEYLAKVTVFELRSKKLRNKRSTPKK